MKERAEQVGGSLDIESAPGRGSTIFLLIPLHEDDQEEDGG
jgi:signal transduction histidine kinase